jgi:hypothetical protein
MLIAIAASSLQTFNYFAGRPQDHVFTKIAVRAMVTCASLISKVYIQVLVAFGADTVHQALITWNREFASHIRGPDGDRTQCSAVYDYVVTGFGETAHLDVISRSVSRPRHVVGVLIGSHLTLAARCP